MKIYIVEIACHDLITYFKNAVILFLLSCLRIGFNVILYLFSCLRKGFKRYLKITENLHDYKPSNMLSQEDFPSFACGS